MGQVWFGTKAHMQWITAPAIDIQAGKTGYSGSANFLNGGSWNRRSKTSAKKYSLAWNMKHRTDVQPILDYADGIYGDDYIYYLDPFAADVNLLPSYWASPFMNCYDGPVLYGDTRPEIQDNGTSENGYPIESAVYTLDDAMTGPSVFVPVPPGYTAHVGAHGAIVSGSASVNITKHTTYAGGPTTVLTFLDKSDTRFNDTVSGDTHMGLTISLGSTSAGTIRLDGIIVQVLRNGLVPPSGGFISGQGTSGLSFVNQPVVSQYSAALDRVGVAVDLVETEAWAWR